MSDGDLRVLRQHRQRGWAASFDTDDTIRVEDGAYTDPVDPISSGAAAIEATCVGCRYPFATALGRDQPSHRLVFSCPMCRRRFYVVAEGGDLRPATLGPGTTTGGRRTMAGSMSRKPMAG